MHIGFSNEPIENAPAGYTRIRLTEGKVTRLVRESEADKLAKGTAGTPVRLFVRFIEQWGN
jgi:hypothetical protein